MNRIITFTHSIEFLDNIITNKPEAHKAIGYLAAWAMGNDRYKSVTIFGDKEGNLHAKYRNEQNEITYDIFAQRGDDGSYTFHS